MFKYSKQTRIFKVDTSPERMSWTDWLIDSITIQLTTKYNVLASIILNTQMTLNT